VHTHLITTVLICAVIIIQKLEKASVFNKGIKIIFLITFRGLMVLKGLTFLVIGYVAFSIVFAVQEKYKL